MSEDPREDFRDGPPSEDAGQQLRLVMVAGAVGGLMLVASVVVDLAGADDPVAPQLPNLPRPTLPTLPTLPSNFPTERSTDLPTDLPTDLELPDLPTDLELPSNFPTELPDLPTDFPTLPELPGGDG